MEERRVRVEEIDRRDGEEDWGSRFIEADRERQRRERWERINKSKYNR